jgi:predicted phage terminase large subunit-like protein
MATARGRIDPRAAEIWRLYPHTFAAHASGGRWKAFRWARWIGLKIGNAVKKGGARICISLPPQTGKSEFFSNWFPQWRLNVFPSRKIILASYEADFASTWGRKVRDGLLRNPLSWTKVSRRSSSASRWDCIDLAGELTGGGMITAGVGGPITGRGGDDLILDDPHKNWKEAQSPTFQKAVVEFFQGTFMTRLRSPRANVFVVMTRWSKKDLIGFLEREHAKDWEFIRLPAIALEDDPLGRKPGEALCPERFPRDFYLCDHAEHCDCDTIKKQVGSRVWQSVYQQEPTSDEGGIIRREWWRFWQEPPARFDKVILSWDCAFKDRKTSSYVVGQVTLHAIEGLAGKWKRYQQCLIEDKANGPAVIEILKRKVQSIKPILPQGSKEARAQAVAPQIEAGNVFLPHPSIRPWVSDYIEEWAAFPFGDDDQVDATTQALYDLTKSRKLAILWS